MHAAIAGQPHVNADGWAGVRSLAVAHAVLRSAESGQTVAVTYG